jgi:hypothetical protein
MVDLQSQEVGSAGIVVYGKKAAVAVMRLMAV